MNFHEDASLGVYEEALEAYVWETCFKPRVMGPGEALYARSDSSFVLWTNDAHTEAYLVDAGSPALLNGLGGLMADAAGIHDTHLYMTHWHIDHCASLGAFIQKTEGTLHLHIHEVATFCFIGWYMENYPYIAKKVEAGEFQIHLVSDTVYSAFGESEIKGLLTYNFPDSTLTHVVPNSSPAIRDPHGNVKIVSGDISFPNPFIAIEFDEFDQTINNWIGEVLARSEAAHDDTVALFFSMGHFDNNVNTLHYQTFPEHYSLGEFRGMILAGNADYTNLELMYIHIKDPYGFTVDLYTAGNADTHTH